MILKLAPVIFLLMSFNSIGKWYYVSPTGNDEHEGSTPEQAKASINKTLELMQPGDSLYLLPGIYRQTIHTVKSGKPDAPIAITGSRSVVITGKKHHRNMHIGHSYIHVSGITFDGEREALKRESSYAIRLVEVASATDDDILGVSIRGVMFKNALAECLRIRRHTKASIIEHNQLSHCGLREWLFDSPKHNSEGIYIGTAPENLVEGSSDRTGAITVRHNIISAPIGECIDVKENVRHSDISYNHCEGAHELKSGAINIRGSENSVTHNIVINTKGAGIRLGGDEERYSTFNQIKHNALVNNQAGGIKIMNWPQNLCGNQVSVSEGQKAIRTRDKYPHAAMEPCL